MTERRRYSRLTASIVGTLAGLVTGFATLLWRFPAYGDDGQPPVCRGTFGTVVPCDSEPLALTWAVLAAVLAGVGTYLIARRVPAKHLHLSLEVR